MEATCPSCGRKVFYRNPRGTRLADMACPACGHAGLTRPATGGNRGKVAKPCVVCARMGQHRKVFVGPDEPGDAACWRHVRCLAGEHTFPAGAVAPCIYCGAAYDQPTAACPIAGCPERSALAVDGSPLGCARHFCCVRGDHYFYGKGGSCEECGAAREAVLRPRA